MAFLACGLRKASLAIVVVCPVRVWRLIESVGPLWLCAVIKGVWPVRVRRLIENVGPLWQCALFSFESGLNGISCLWPAEGIAFQQFPHNLLRQKAPRPLRGNVDQNICS